MPEISEITYNDKMKFFRDKNGRWALHKGAVISSEGRSLVESEPNISDETLKKLIELEWDKIPEKERELIKEDNKVELASIAFGTGPDIGIAHLSQCIDDNRDQSMAELIGRYADERRMPFILGAVYIKALAATRPLFYYTSSPTKGYRKVRWEPANVYVPPEPSVPPEKKKRRIRKKPLLTKPKVPVYRLYVCPACGSPAKLLRCGHGNRLWHACCTDPDHQCGNFAGLPPVKTEKMAATQWNSYVKDVGGEEIWSDLVTLLPEDPEKENS